VIDTGGKGGGAGHAVAPWFLRKVYLLLYAWILT
jgi:hypothetical protein